MEELVPLGNSASAIAAAVSAGQLGVEEVCRFYADRTDALHGQLNSHITWDRESFLAEGQQQAERIREGLAGGQQFPLAGVPVLVKDNICTRGIPTTAASKILQNFSPLYDATVITRLREAGAVIAGKANMDEFAMGSSSESSWFGPVKNPWDTERVPGGSSGGSAAAVALVPVALGSDTGGSVRQPASFCGIVGMKPTWGRVSRYGLIAYGSSLDQIGPLTRNISDAALVHDVIAGHDSRDSTSADRPDDHCYADLLAFQKESGGRYDGFTIGVLKESYGPGLGGGVRRAFDQALSELEKSGARLVEVSIPDLRFAIATYYITATAEASSNLSRFDGIRYGYRSQTSGPGLDDLYLSSRSEGFGREVKQRIMLGAHVLSSGYYDAYYEKATHARQILRDQYAAAFKKADLIVCPTAPKTAFRLGENLDDSLSMYLGDIFTISLNLVGNPGLSLPCGFDDAGLPVGIQFMAPQHQESLLFKGAYIYEQSTKWTEKQRPHSGS